MSDRDTKAARLPLADRVARRFGYSRTSDLSALVSSVLTSQATGVVQEKSYSALVDCYKSWVYTSIDKIAKTVAMLPLKLYVYRRDGQKILDPRWIRTEEKNLPSVGERKYYLKQMGVEKQEVLSHPFLDLIHRPNGIMTRFLLWYETMIRLELAGLCGWYMPKNGLGIPGEIWPLPLSKTAEFRPIVEPTMEISGWYYQDGNVNKTLPPDEVLLHKYPSPVSPYHGMSPLMAQTYPYDLDLFFMQQQTAFYQNKGVPGLHLHTDQNLGKQQVDEIRQQLMAEFGATIRSGRPLVTHSGLKADKTGFSPRENMIDKVAKYAREKLITAYDLSEGKLGLVSDVNRANIEALDVSFVRECLKPKCMMIEETIETFLLPRYDLGLTCDYDLPDTGDKEFALKERELNLRNLVTVVNEERGKMGLKPVSWGDLPWMQLSMIQLGSEPEGPPAKGLLEVDGEGDESDPAFLAHDLDEYEAKGGIEDFSDGKKNGSGRRLWPGHRVGSAY